MQDDDNARAAAADAQENADFAAGFGEPAPKPETPAPQGATETTEQAAGQAADQTPPPETPEYVQVTAKELAEIKAAAAKTALYDQQLSKAFGTIGNLQQQMANLQGQPRGGKVELPADAFAEMERDFPELAAQIRTGLEKALSNGPAAGSAPDPAAALGAEFVKREMADLDDDHPKWREIVGAVDGTTQQPDPNNPFRRWLATKDAEYQAKVNSTQRASVIGRAITRFQNETRTAQRPGTTPRGDARADRIKAAVQPRGDNAPAPPSKSDNDEFEAGFHAR